MRVEQLHEVCSSCLMSVNLSIASKVTEIGRNSVVMYVSDEFIDSKLQLTHVWNLYAPYSVKKHLSNALTSYTFICNGTPV